ncbi:MAG TPA: hypothetical protein VMR18_04370 [Candidatus Saccharimonadales bacterium]|nr:hypothetical protein [Candidatus Saccharimonadales bacterium]
MKIPRRTKLNSKGFGHVELLLVVVLVVALAGVGYFVYQHDKKTVTVHAGSYKYIGVFDGSALTGSDLPNMSVYVCRTSENSIYGPLFQIRDLVALSKPMPNNGWTESITMSRYPSTNISSPGSPTVTTSNSEWWDGLYQENSIYVSQLKVNYIVFFATGGTKDKGGSSQVGSAIRPEYIPAC